MALLHVPVSVENIIAKRRYSLGFQYGTVH